MNSLKSRNLGKDVEEKLKALIQIHITKFKAKKEGLPSGFVFTAFIDKDSNFKDTLAKLKLECLLVIEQKYGEYFCFEEVVSEVRELPIYLGKAISELTLTEIVLEKDGYSETTKKSED